MPKKNKINIRKRNGKFQIRFMIDGQEYSKTVESDSMDNAIDIKTKMELDIKSGNYISKSDITLNEFYSTFRRDYLVPKSAEMTINDYDVKYNRYALNRIGKMKIQNIKAVDIYDFYSNVRNTSNAKEGTLKIVHSYLRKILNFACDLDYISKNPMAKVETPKPVVEKFVVWTPEEVNQFLDYSKARNIWTYLPMAFTIMTGLRRSEVCGLKWEDVDFNKKTIKLTRTVHQITGKPYPVIQLGKTEKSMATIPVPEMAINLLRDIISLHMITMTQIGKDKFNNKDGWVFLNSSGGLINSGWVTNSFRENLQSLDLPRPMNLKGFRHMFATFLLQKNIHPKVVQELLRHSTFKLTMDTYSHVVESVGREAVSSIDDILSGAKQN